ncbi:aspartic peptidase A1 family [Artemisia annua]|uniref:Aspartic peptidase A1 family n=1 Tax=Artemisia annua TaxID=35608 RepID=A0A2U1KM66_ARTAN|nr:aspartic peptidase A1 family [Artemisia annua]
MYLVKIFFFITLSFFHNVVSQSTPFNTSVIPIVKDASTSLHKVSYSFRVPDSDTTAYLLVDLDAPFVWKDCVLFTPDVACGLEEGCRFPLRCDNPLCKEAQTFKVNSTCPSLNIAAKYGCGICAVNPSNPISKTCKLSQLTTDLVTIYSTDGRNPTWGANFPFGTEMVISCAPKNLLPSLPKDVYGVAAFSWSALAFPKQLNNPDVADKFALCLATSSSAVGVAFLGDGPFYFRNLPKVDLRSFLSYTPMIRKDSKSLGFYIHLNQILVEGAPVALSTLKSQSVKLSTSVPYTTLRSDIYKAFMTSFSKATANINPKVKAVKPFSLCVKSSAISSVPNIDLETESGKIWTISKENSMKDVGNGFSCLAFFSGGSRAKDAIVIGTYQMENNFLYFDLVNQKLGFSSSLLARGTSCGSFNFTELPRSN